MTKKIFITLNSFIGLGIIILLALYFIPPKTDVIRYDYPEIENDNSLNLQIGWYRTDDGQHYQITWGAKNGLQLNHFNSLRRNLINFRLTKVDDNLFDTDGDLETAEVKFTPKDSEMVVDVSTSKIKFTAIKQDNLHYKQQELEYWNGDVKLAALLMTPVENNRSTAIIFVHGSGSSDRDNFWYMYQADYLARNGFTVLLPDKRGSGKSRGEWHTASFDDLANDIGAAQKYLIASEGSEFERLGVLGLSQGGWISHLVNHKFDGIDFIIDVVSSSGSPNAQVQYEIKNEIKNSGVPDILAKPLSIVFTKRAKEKRKVWWEKNGSFDPIPLIRETNVPVLKIFGENDNNVPVKISLSLINDMVLTHPNVPLTVKVFNGSGHALFDPDTQWVRDDYLDYLIDWASK